MLYYNLNKPISIEKLINDVQVLISKQKADLTNKILCVNITEIKDHNGDSLLPKLTHEVSNIYN